MRVHLIAKLYCVYITVGLGSSNVYDISKSMPIAIKLASVDNDEVFKCYVHDFVMYSSGSSEYNEDTKVYG